MTAERDSLLSRHGTAVVGKGGQRFTLYANGWHTNDVTVTFYADDGLSGIASVTSPVTVTNEAADQLVEGIAIDNAGNTADSAVLVNIDTHAPTVTGSPADGDVTSATKPPFVVEFADELSGVDSASLQVTLDGTNVTANFQSFAAGSIWVPTNDLAAIQHQGTSSSPTLPATPTPPIRRSRLPAAALL